MQYAETVGSTFGQEIGIYGWRKRCLYVLLLGLAVVILCNLVATLLLINVINFNLGGLGELRVSSSGLHLRGYSYVLDSLFTSRLSSRPRQPLAFETSYNMSAVLRDDAGVPTQALHFWSATEDPQRRSVAASAGQFRVNDLRGRALFTAEEGHVSVGADTLKVLEGGAKFTGSVQTPMLRSNLGAELMLESATRRLRVDAPSGVSIESRAADISASCLTDLRLSSSDGKVKIKGPGVYIPNLESIPLLQPQPARYFHRETSFPKKVYQVCMCGNGKLFVSPPDGECSVDNDGIQCR